VVTGLAHLGTERATLPDFAERKPLPRHGDSEGQILARMEPSNANIAATMAV